MLSVRVTFQDKESVEKALKLDRELRINGFLVTVSKYRDDDEQKAHNANVNKVYLTLWQTRRSKVTCESEKYPYNSLFNLKSADF